jgi:hypothetical protein
MSRRQPSVAAILRKPTTTPDELFASKLIPAGRNAIYDACNSYLNAPECGTGIECFRLGKLIIIPTAPLRRKLGIEAA